MVTFYGWQNHQKVSYREPKGSLILAHYSYSGYQKSDVFNEKVGI